MAAAVADRELAQAVALYKSAFFAEKDRAGNWIDYRAAVSGGLQLVPTDDAGMALEQDYRRMVDEGLLLDEAEPFARLMNQIQAVQKLANAKRS